LATHAISSGHLDGVRACAARATARPGAPASKDARMRGLGEQAARPRQLRVGDGCCLAGAEGDSPPIV